MKIASTVRTLLLAASLVFPTYGIAETAADYNNRGIGKVAKGDFDGAIADYSRALELDPKFAAAYRRRGIAKQANSDFDGAIADYNRALELDPKLAIAYADRGISHFSSRHWSEALKDFNHFLDLSKDEQDYPRLFVWMITARLNGADAANKDLTAYLDRRSNAAPSDWFSNVAGHLLGKVTQADLFAAAKSPDTKKESGQLCEAWFYSGMKKLLDGDKTAAADHFRKCLATEQKIFVEYQFAQTELKSLAQ
jgi:lipoprotein NlpI